MMELVDMRDLGSREAIRVGSSPTTRTKIKAPAKAGAFILVSTELLMYFFTTNFPNAQNTIVGFSSQLIYNTS